MEWKNTIENLELEFEASSFGHYPKRIALTTY